MFRYYIHDPWWVNSPWLDRYGREPHDIYLPLAAGRVDERGKVATASNITMLTVDDSYGHMPDVVPQEVIPHVQRAFSDAPDEPGLFIRSAVNQGFPLNTVVSTKNFLLTANNGIYDQTILVTPPPDAGTPLAQTLLAHVQNGGKLLLYGPLRHTARELLQLLDLKFDKAIAGDLEIHTTLLADRLRQGCFPKIFRHRESVSGGGIDTTPAVNLTAVLSISSAAFSSMA
jgi:hypothetical protein